jgi:glucose dehydrogenase
MCYSGSIVTAGGLSFVGRNDNRFTALDKSNGDLLWDFETDAAVNATASTFLHDGKQYVVVLAAGSFFPGTKRGDSLWLFSLDGEFVSDTSGGARNTAPSAPRAGAGD